MMTTSAVTDSLIPTSSTNGSNKNSNHPPVIRALQSTNNTRPYQTVVQLQSVRPTARSVTRDITSLPNDVSEERYWVEKFGLGKNAAQIKLYGATTKHTKFAHPRHVTLQVGTSSIVHQIIIGTTATAPNEKVMLPDDTKPIVVTSTTNTTSNVKHTLMVGICGPRVPLYGTTPQSKIHRALFSHNTNTGTNHNITTIVIDPDRNVPTSGQLAISASLRNDGRLLAIGTMNGTIRIADTTTRATLCQFGFMNSSSNSKSNNNKHAMAPLPIRYVQWFRNGQHIVSMGDDAMVRIWKLGGGGNFGNIMMGHSTQSSVPLLSCSGHGDAIRCGALYQKPPLTTKQQQQQSKTNVTSSGIGSQYSNMTVSAIVASGSYDHTIRIWDVDHLEDTDAPTNGVEHERNNSNRCLHILHHGGPVETLLFMKRSSNSSSVSPTFLISGGGTCIKVWDPFMGIEIHTIQLQHRKSITCMIAVPRIRNEEYYSNEVSSRSSSSNSHNDMRLITGGLDGLMRVHKFDNATGQLEFVHGIHVNIPQNNMKAISTSGTTQAATKAVAITSLAATVTGDRIAIGMANGTILVCQKGIPIQTLKRTNDEPSAGTYAFFTRGMNADPSNGDTIVVASSNKKRKLAKYDIALKQFRYSDALDEALATRIPRTVVAVLEELGKRQGLTIALSNRDEESLEPILSFIVRYITRPRFAALLIGVTNILINIYSEVTGQSEMIDELFAKLQNQVSEEIRTQKVLFRVVGQLDAILATTK